MTQNSNYDALEKLTKREYSSFLALVHTIEKQRTARNIASIIRSVCAILLSGGFLCVIFKIFSSNDDLASKLALLLLTAIPFGIGYALIIDNYKKTKTKQKEEKEKLLYILAQIFFDGANFKIKNDYTEGLTTQITSSTPVNATYKEPPILKGSTMSGIIPLTYLVIVLAVCLLIGLFLEALPSQFTYRHQERTRSANEGLVYAGAFIYSAYRLSKFKHNISMLPQNKLNIFKRHGQVDDHFEIEYHGIPVDIQELIFMNNERMLLLSFPQPKPTNATIIVKSKDYKFIQSNFDKIRLEDAEFNRLFEISANSQLESRFMLTPSFMERLKTLHKAGTTIACSYEHGYVYIAVKPKKDLFEFHGNESLLSKEVVVRPLLELKEVLSIIDTLRIVEEDIEI